MSPETSEPRVAARSRRIMAIHLPRTLSEVAEGGTIALDSSLGPGNSKKRALRGIIVVDGEADKARSSDRLDAVCLRSERAGLKQGMTIAEARALVAELSVEYVEKQAVVDQLISVAEVAKSFGPTISWDFPDTVWVDVTGVSHLFGGEDELCRRAQEQVRLLGHVTRVCIADGPLIARAIARFGGPSCQAVPRERTQRILHELPLLALPLSRDRIAWLSRVGVFSVGQLAALPRKSASARLGDDALKILDLAEGHDPEPLVPGEFPRLLCEEVGWEEAVPGSEPLLFALRGLIAKVSARLRGRGEASSHLSLTLLHDRAVARHRGTASQTVLDFELAAPLSMEGDLERALRGRLERLFVKAPTIGLRLEATQLSPELLDQMHLSEASTLTFSSNVALPSTLVLPSAVDASGTVGSKSPSAANDSLAMQATWLSPAQRERQFAVLLAELEADVGRGSSGVLRIVDSLLPETSSELCSLRPARRVKKGARSGPLKSQRGSTSRGSTSRGSGPRVRPRPLLQRWTRIFLHPHSISAHLALGESFGLGNVLYTIDNLRFIERLDGVEWWTPRSTSRDYFWAWLSSPQGGTEALLFVDRLTNERFVQAFGD